MTEKEVREIFFKNFLGGDLNEELIACEYEIYQKVVGKLADKQNRFEDILVMIDRSQCLAILFGSLNNGSVYFVPITYFVYLDELRETTARISDYLLINYDATSSWFKERFDRENLVDIGEAISLKIDSEKVDGNKSFTSIEIQMYLEICNIALIAIFGEDTVRKLIDELNKCLAVLRLCQREAQKLNELDTSKCRPS